MSKQSYRGRVAQEMIEAMERGTAPWVKPWQAGEVFPDPINPVTRKNYRGMNRLLLSSKGLNDPRWMTYKQAQSLGGQVRKGERATPIEYWQWREENTLLDEKGEVQKQAIKLARPRVFYANLFNATQIDGLEAWKAPERSFDPLEEAEKLIQDSPAKVHHDQQNRAYYSLGRDEIHLLAPEAFKERYEYYARGMPRAMTAASTASLALLARKTMPGGTVAKYPLNELFFFIRDSGLLCHYFLVVFVCF